jgi:hypothetical protein
LPDGGVGSSRCRSFPEEGDARGCAIGRRLEVAGPRDLDQPGAVLLGPLRVDEREDAGQAAFVDVAARDELGRVPLCGQ